MKSSFPHLSTTPSFERILGRFDRFYCGDPEADVGHLVLALLTEESLGARCLAELGVSIAGIAEGCFGQIAADTAGAVLEDATAESPVVPFPGQSCSSPDGPDQCDWFRSVRERAIWIARRGVAGTELSSEHLLLAMVEVAGLARELLSAIGVTEASVRHELLGESSTEPVAVDFQLHLTGSESDSDLQSGAGHELVFETDQRDELPATLRPLRASIADPVDCSADYRQRVFAVIDANLNRAREGLRVLEDFARFIQQQHDATSGLKQLRHDLVQAEQQLNVQFPQIIRQRDTAADPGTRCTTAGEQKRDSLSSLLTANARRVQEALRSLEEFGKVLNSEFSAAMKQLRYQSYVLEQSILSKLTDDHVAVDPKADS
ncbi:MAG: Clp protease N-terminal domain-containing protein [Planctomycetaceae bacterium]